MAMTEAERKRLQRERQRDERKRSEDSTHEFLREPFFEFLEDDGNWSSVEMAFDMMGMAAPDFENDEGPGSYSGQIEEETYDNHPGSIGRAEIMIEALLDAATQLADIVNRYKLQEIDRCLAGLRRADLGDHGVRAKALEDVVKLTRIRDQLLRKTRWTLPQWTVKEN